jgi:hypothetical protein
VPKTENRNVGALQPVALAVQRTVVPTTCGEAGFGARATLLHEAVDPLVVRVYGMSGLVTSTAVKAASRAVALMR